MDSIQFSEFSTTGVNNSDTFDVWRKKTNGVIDQLGVIKDSISPLFYTTNENTTALLRAVTLNETQTITGAKTFSGGTREVPILKVGTAGLYETGGVLGTTGAFTSDRVIINNDLQFGAHSYSVPPTRPLESSLLETSGSSLTWKSLNSIVSQIKSEGAVNVVTTNIVLPVGSIVDYAISAGSPPTNWLRCSGSRFNGGDYEALATLLLNTYGTIYTDETGTTEAPAVEYNSTYWYTLPTASGKIIKSKADPVVNTFIDRGNTFDILRGGVPVQSISLTDGGSATLNLRHDNTLRVDAVNRELGVSPFSVAGDKITPNAVDPSKLSLGGPSWDASSSALYEGADTNNRRRVATRDYVDSKIFKTGPVKKLVSRPASGPHSSAPAFGEFCYINHDGVPVVTGKNRNSRFGFTADKYSHCEMPLPENRRAVELHVGYTFMCALDETGELWAIGVAHHNMFNIVPFPGPTNGTAFSVTSWTKAYTPLYAYSTNNKIRKVIVSGDVDINNVAVIDTSNRLWIAGYNQHGVLGRGNSGTTTTSTATKPAGEATPVLENVLDAFLVGSWNNTIECATCIALTPSGIHMSGYGGQGQNGNGNNTSVNNTFNTITIPQISDYSACNIYGAGEDESTSIFVKTPNNLVYAWGYNTNNVFGDGSGTNKNRPTQIFIENPDLNIDNVYTTVHQSGQGATYLSGQRNNATAQRGTNIESTTAQHFLGTSISSDDTGNIVAIGSPGLNGRVQCYVYSSNAWTNYGTTIATAESNALFGQSVSLNSAGTRLCIGAPDGQIVGTSKFGQVRIYNYSAELGWVQLGQNFSGELNASKLGTSVALSGDGNTFIAGAPGYNGNIGRVYIRRITPTGTDPVGDSITGTAVNQQCGLKVAINTSGTIIAVASNGNSTAGVVRVYSLVGNNWVQLGGDIAGRVAADGAINISLNGSGTLLAVGAPGADTAGSASGTTRVFSYDSLTTSWIQLGSDIYGQSVNEASGTAVAFSRDGSVLAIGAPNADVESKTDSGVVRLFTFDDGKWKLLTATLSGEIGSEKFGGAVAISATGTNVLASSPTWSTNRGRVRSIGFISSPTTSYEIWCAGKNTGNKFSFAGDAVTWKEIGELPVGYQIKDFWPGNGYESNSVNFIKARRQSDGLYYLFVVGSNSKYEAGYGNNTVLNTWTLLNLQSHIVDSIIDIQSVSPYGGEDYTVLHLNDGTLYFAGYNSFMIDPNLPNNEHRTDFTRIK